MLNRSATSLFFGLVVVTACAMAPSLALAQTPITFQYYYDAAAQLIRVVDSTGIVIEYVYDAVGNAVEVKPSSINPTQLTIFGFSPAQGGRGTLVTIQGVGFTNTGTSPLVSFNGTPAAILSATANTLVTQVPPGASSGPITATLASNAATSPTPFAVLAVPVVTSVSPRAIEVTRPPGTLSITGANLTASLFTALPAFFPAGLTFGTPQVDAAGTAAVLSLSVTPNTRGTFVLVSTNTAGSSSAFASPGNTLSVTNTQDSVDADGDGFPDALEVLLGSDPFDAASVPDANASGDIASPQSAVLNVSSPVAGKTIQAETESPSVSLLNSVSPVFSQLIASETTSPQVSLLDSVSPIAGKTVAAEVAGTQLSVLNSTSPVNSQKIPTEVSSPLVSMLNAVSPIAGQGLLTEIFSPLVSLRNALASSQTPGTSALSAQSSAAPAEKTTDTTAASNSSVTLRMDVAGSRESLYEGETVRLIVDANASDANGIVNLVVNGTPFTTVNTPPYLFLFTVPADLTRVTFRAALVAADGSNQLSNELTVPVSNPPGGAVLGRVVDENGAPVPNATIAITGSGLRAKYVDFQAPLEEIPDLRNGQAGRETFVSAVNVLNPGKICGADPVGTRFAPDYAAQLSGTIHIETAGRYQFGVVADEGVRVLLDGVPVIERLTGSGSRTSAQVQTDLSGGEIPLEVDYYSATGDGELQLYYRQPGDRWQIVPPDALSPGVTLVTVTSDQNGVFVVQDLPVHLGPLRLTVSRGDTSTERVTALIAPGRSTNVGDVRVTVR